LRGNAVSRSEHESHADRSKTEQFVNRSADRNGFPKQIGAFERERGIQYDNGGYPMATTWQGRIALADAFYYRNAPFAREYAGARDAVKIATPSARLLSDAPSTLHPSG
jgi:hypothetical protein